jgi:hypothetical protein
MVQCQTSLQVLVRCRTSRYLMASTKAYTASIYGQVYRSNTLPRVIGLRRFQNNQCVLTLKPIYPITLAA